MGSICRTSVFRLASALVIRGRNSRGGGRHRGGGVLHHDQSGSRGHSGWSAWFDGVLVLTVHLVFAMTLYLLPQSGT